ncbi:MAG: hypothetical protein ABIJ97_02050 [Bacteroidota bacterium]
MRFFLIVTLLFCAINSIYSGNDNFPIGSRSAAMGSASVTFQDVWAYSHNQAGLAGLDNITLGFHHENKYFVKEYGLQSFGIAVPTNSGVFGLNMNYFGYSKYNESKIGLSYSRKLLDKLFIGIQLDYFYNHIADNYGNTGTVAAEIGILAQPIENLYFGAHVFNPTQSKIASYNNERIPTIFRIGIGYKFSDQLYVSVETEKDIDNKPVYKAGIEYMAIENLYFRAGVKTNPLQNTFGLGYKIKKFRADIAFSTHPQLGITPYISISYGFNKSEASGTHDQIKFE